ncbi:MAG: hypothetical protein DMG10_04250 [Acidobacteria bacterium]|nr:MAG: hypothetical protein DMG10_04250 [Acidobacteriota bacterium]
MRGFSTSGPLLSIFAFFYFPVFLDSRAVHGPPRNSLPWAAVLLLLLAGPVYLLLNSSFVGARVLPHSYQPMFFYAQPVCCGPNLRDSLCALRAFAVKASPN